MCQQSMQRSCNQMRSSKPRAVILLDKSLLAPEAVNHVLSVFVPAGVAGVGNVVVVAL
jgi:hypothetical protein